MGKIKTFVNFNNQNIFEYISRNNIQLVKNYIDSGYDLNIKNSDVSNFILAQQNTFAKDEKLSDFASKMIKNHTGEVKPENGNLITPYIYLYYQIKESIEFVEKYKELAEQIKKVEM
jgi:hypothetical protein